MRHVNVLTTLFSGISSFSAICKYNFIHVLLYTLFMNETYHISHEHLKKKCFKVIIIFKQNLIYKLQDFFVFANALEGTLVLRKPLDYESISNFSVGIRAQVSSTFIIVSFIKKNTSF